MTDLVDKIRKEAEFLETLLQGLGFHLHARKSIEDCLDSVTDTLYYTVDCYTIRLDNMTVGNCCIYHRINKILLFTSTLNAKHIPEEMIDSLMLLGYEIDDDNWLEYEVEIK